MGCKFGLNSHQFGSYTGKCKFCDIIGCKYGFMNHEFGRYTGECKFCGIKS